MQTSQSRRTLITSAAAAALAAMAPPLPAAEVQERTGDALKGLKLGIATYSLRKLPLDAAIKAIQRVGVTYVSIKDFHLPMKSSTEQRKEVIGKFKAAGITPLSVGVIYLSSNEESCRAAFDYTRDCGVNVMVASCAADALDLVEQLAKEYDIRIAIHNHGPEDKRWPTPNAVMESIGQRDPHLGLCIDVGHTARAGVDPATAILDFHERLYDMHIKDVSALHARGASAEIEVGRGVLDIRSMLQALLKIKYTHHVGLEHEKDAADPTPGIAESIGYIRGVMSCIG